MNTLQHQTRFNLPGKSLFLLLILTIVSMIVTQLVVYGLFELLLKIFRIDGESSGVKLCTVYVMMIASTLGTFLAPAYLLQRLEPYQTYFPSSKSKLLLFLLAVVFLFVLAPIMQLVAEWNAGMKLPASLEGLESWMRKQEDATIALVGNVAMTDNIGLLLLNIVVMAIFPAIAEEFFFRGSLTNIIGRMTVNKHVSIWIVALIFSAIHVQFYGFVPRVILGAVFGYMLLWTNNIWVPVLVHFVNNAMVTILAFVYARQGKTYEELQAYTNYSIFAYLGSAILATVIAIWFYNNSVQKKLVDGERLDKNKNL